MRVGTATVDITPESGSLMACFPKGPAREPRRAEGAHDRLKARALVLDDGVLQIALCACDLCMIRDVDVARIRSRVVEQVPSLGGSKVLVAASHTHSSPETGYLFGNTPDDPWVAEMDDRIASAVVEAHADLKPAMLSIARARLPLNHNRRVDGADGSSLMKLEFEEGVTTGPCDDELMVLSFMALEGDDALAVVYNYTAHALTVGPGNMLYTADYPGVASALIESRHCGCTALFTNGAAGNIHPRSCMRTDWDALEDMGRGVGEAVIAAMAADAPVGVDTMAFVHEKLEFQNRMDNSRRVSVELACLKIGPVVMAFVPGELFVEFQIEFKRRVQPAVGLVVGYANGWCGYIPTRSAYDRGGYGVDACESDPVDLSRTALPVGAGEEMLDRLLRMADGLSQG